MVPLLYPFRYSEDEVAAVVEAAWRAVSAAAVAASEAAEVETFSLSIDVVGVFVETILHPYCLRLERKLSLKLNEGAVEAEAAPARY